MRIRSLQAVIQTPRNCQSKSVRIRRRSKWERAGCRRYQKWWNIGQAGESRSCVNSQGARWIGESGRQAVGALAVKCIDDAHAEVVEINTIASANRALAGAAKQPPTGRVSKSKSRRQISIVPVPVRLAAIRLS